MNTEATQAQTTDVEVLLSKKFPISITKKEIAYKLGRPRFCNLYRSVFTDEVLRAIGDEDENFLKSFKHRGKKTFYVHNPSDRKVFLYLMDYLQTNWQ